MLFRFSALMYKAHRIHYDVVGFRHGAGVVGAAVCDTSYRRTAVGRATISAQVGTVDVQVPRQDSAVASFERPHDYQRPRRCHGGSG